MKKQLKILFSVLILLLVASIYYVSAIGFYHFENTLTLKPNNNYCTDNGGELVAQIVQNVKNDDDSGIGGNAWAKDNYRRTIYVYQMPDSNSSYCAMAIYRGTFLTYSARSPNDAVYNRAGIDGRMSGGSIITFTGEIKELSTKRHNTVSRVRLGTVDYQCDGKFNCPGWYDWRTKVFEEFQQDPTFIDWGWDYRASRFVNSMEYIFKNHKKTVNPDYCSEREWLNAKSGNEGDIACEDDSSEHIGYIGCSSTSIRISGYHEIGGEKFWAPQGAYFSNSILDWANKIGDNVTRGVWVAFDKQLAEFPGTDKVWIELCIRDVDNITYEDTYAVVENVRAKIPGVTIFVSPIAGYSDHLCHISGAIGIPTGKEFAKKLASENSDVFLGPALSDLTWNETDSAGCHPNDSGARIWGQELKDFFG